MAHDNGGQGWAPATYLEPLMSNGTEEDTYDWISVTDADGKGLTFIISFYYKIMALIEKRDLI